MRKRAHHITPLAPCTLQPATTNTQHRLFGIPYAGVLSLYLLSVLIFMNFMACSSGLFPWADTTTAPPPTKTDTLPADTVSLEHVRFDTTEADTFHINGSCRLSLVLPLYLDFMSSKKPSNTNEAGGESGSENPAYPSSLPALQFYQGARMALDTVNKKMRGGIELFVFDTHNNPDKMREILQSPDLQSSDYIIGPFHRANLLLMDTFSRRHQIPFVSPYLSDTQVVRGNPYCIMAAPAYRRHGKVLAAYTRKFHREDHMLVIHSDSTAQTAREKQLSGALIGQLQKSGRKQDTLIRMAHVQPDHRKIAPLLHDTLPNIVLIPSLDQSYVYYVLSQLGRLQEEYKIKVLGPGHWLRFESIDLTLYETLDVHITNNFFIPLAAPDVQRFRKDFIKRYKMLPERHAYVGYDLISYIAEICLTYGSHYEYGFADKTCEGLAQTFHITPVLQHGTPVRFENSTLYVRSFRSLVLPEDTTTSRK